MNSALQRQLDEIMKRIPKPHCAACYGTLFRVVIGGTEEPRREDHACPECSKIPEQLVWIAEDEDGPQ